MSGTYMAVQALGFATGAVLFVLLAALALRAERLAGAPYNGTRAAVLCFLWNFGSLGQFLALLCGLSQRSTAWRLSAAIAWCALGVLPTVVLLLLQPARWGTGWQARAGRSFLWVSRAIAVLLTLAFVMTAFSPGFKIAITVPAIGVLGIAFNTAMKLSAYNLILNIPGAIMLVRGATQLTRAGRAYSRTILLWMVGLGLLLMITIHARPGPAVEFTLETVTQQSTIPVAILSLVFLGQFRFADVFLKRSLVILAAVVIALMYVLLVVGPAVGLIHKSAPYPEAGAWLASTILWGLLLLLFPAVERATRRAADRWLFRRPDYRVLSEQFSRQSDGVQNESELFELALHVIQTSVDVASARIEPACPIGNETKDEAAGPASVATSPGSHHLGWLAAEVRVPIQVVGTRGYIIVAQTGERRRKLLSDELRFLSLLADRMGRKIQSLGFEREMRRRELREARLRQLLAEANLKALRAQLNPHFLFNTLNTILDLIASQPDKAEAMTERLAEVFRHVVTRTEREMISVGEEIEFLSKYLEIERVRFGDRLLVRLDVDPLVVGEPIPPLILQPLVENALKHGLSRKLGAGTVRIAAATSGNEIHLAVEDDGVGWRCDDTCREQADSTGSPAGVDRQSPGPASPGLELGMRNVRERLAAVYGDGARMSVSSSPGLGASVRITIPKRGVEDSANRRRNLGEVSTAETTGRTS